MSSSPRANLNLQHHCPVRAPIFCRLAASHSVPRVHCLGEQLPKKNFSASPPPGAPAVGIAGKQAASKKSPHRLSTG